MRIANCRLHEHKDSNPDLRFWRPTFYHWTMDVCVDQVQGIEPWIDLIARQAVYFIIGLVFETNQLPVCWYFTWLWRNVRFIVSRLGLEPRTHSLEGCCSIQLNYRDVFWYCVPTWTRTKDPRIKNPLLYSNWAIETCSVGVGRLERPVPKGTDLQSVRLPITGYTPEYEEKKHCWTSRLERKPPSNYVWCSDQLNYVHDKITFLCYCWCIISLKHVIHQHLWKRRNLMCGFSWTRTTFSGFSVQRIYHICQESMMLGVVTESNRQLRSHSAIC